MSVSHTPTDPSATTRAEGKGGSECVSGECVSECSGVQSRVVFGPESDSWCARHAKLVHFTHSWSIEQFTYCYDNDPSTRPLVWSAILSASPREKYRFYLKLYPKGQHEEARDHLSLLLNLCITGSLIVHYKFSIVDADGNKCHTKGEWGAVPLLYQLTYLLPILSIFDRG